jgi:hypothetical protein
MASKELKVPVECSTHPVLKWARLWLGSTRTEKEGSSPSGGSFVLALGTICLGADWQVIRRTALRELEARYTLETDDGALIYVLNQGIRSGSKEVMGRLARGEKVHASEYYFRTRPFSKPAHRNINGCTASSPWPRVKGFRTKSS